MAKQVHHAISLFSNCGAGDVGYKEAGFKFDVMAELVENRMKVCLLNHPEAKGVPGDLRETWKQVVQEYKKKTDNAPLSFLAACPPCQGMSSARSGRGNADDPDAGAKDERNLLVTVIANVTRALKPRIIVVENVQAFLTRQIRHPKTGVPISAARLLIQDLSKNYDVFPVMVDLAEFGVPQTRKRTFLTFVRKDISALEILKNKDLFPYPIPSHAEDFGGKPVTLEAALKNFSLSPLDASSSETARSKENDLHSVPVWLEHYYAMVAAIPPHVGGSGWENNLCAKCGDVEVEESDAICPECGGPLLRPVVREKNGEYRLVHGFRSSTYRRMKSHAPAATITTATGHIGSNSTLHPYENRVLSTLECALLQTFPIDFQWGEAMMERGHTRIREMIGEAVPPMFTRKHGEVLISLLNGKVEDGLLAAKDKRATKAVGKLDLG